MTELARKSFQNVLKQDTLYNLRNVRKKFVTFLLLGNSDPSLSLGTPELHINLPRNDSLLTLEKSFQIEEVMGARGIKVEEHMKIAWEQWVCAKQLKYLFI